ncbi:MAG TPA: hypothetical protein P5270_08225 [Victivallales bacterium]|nr:hypothetical protein [Victivallales bacterium]HPO90518.1 hypothetical protein [Victivallales bacterium]HRR29334.1 hypothetical protein [Victivallales bacterium]
MNYLIDPIAEKHLNTYIEATGIFKNCLKLLRDESKADFTPLKDKLKEIISLLKESDRYLMGIANTPYQVLLRKCQISESEMDIILYGLNLAIYSLSISIDIGVPEEHLIYIAMVSVCNHIGYLNSQPSNPNEITDTTEINKKDLQNSFPKIVIDGLDMDSLALLSGLMNDDKLITTKTSVQESMYQYAIIVSLCNSYEKLMHKTLNGKYLPPAEAMKLMRNDMNGYFNKNIIKIFFNKFSVFPIGSFVKLNTKETAKIVEINDGFVMRPVVMVVLDSDDLEKIPPVRINLKEKPTLYIKNSILDEMLSEKYLTLF